MSQDKNKELVKEGNRKRKLPSRDVKEKKNKHDPDPPISAHSVGNLDSQFMPDELSRLFEDLVIINSGSPDEAQIIRSRLQIPSAEKLLEPITPSIQSQSKSGSSASSVSSVSSSVFFPPPQAPRLDTSSGEGIQTSPSTISNSR